MEGKNFKITFGIGINDHCPNPLCHSTLFKIDDSNGYQNLICADCGETIINDVFQNQEFENKQENQESE